MLQSPKPRIQRQQRRLTSASETSVLGAKQDPQRRIQRPTFSRQNAPSIIQRGAPGKQQHRRHLSVPDNVLMSIASASVQGGVHDDYKFYQPNTGGSDMMDVGSDRRRQIRDSIIINNDKNNSNFFLQPSPKLITPSHQEETTSAQNQYLDFVQAPQDDATRMIDDLFSFNTSSPITQGPPIRRGSAPQHSTFDMESMRRAQTFHSDNSSLPIPPHGAHMQCISTFDLAPLHPNFVNLATLNMPIDNDVESYYSPRSDIPSPTFPTVQRSPRIQDANAFENSMSTVPEEPFTDEDRPMVKIPPLPENTTFDLSEIRPQRRERGETTPQPMGAKSTGISMEEITSFIAGPEVSDGKWVCKYPDCDKRFGRKENIKSHVQTHLGDRQYRCEVCKKCFVRQHDLKRHSKIHTGIKPYPCLCGNSFARHDALTRHRQRGMCIGAFEGIVKKVAKRGRPRKKPLNDDGTEPTKKSKSPNHDLSSSSGSSSESDVSDPRTPTALDTDSPAPDTPNFDQYDSSASSTARSIKEESPGLMPHTLDSPDYTPPTSPPEFYELENFTSKLDGGGSKRDSYSSSSLPDDDYMPREIDYSDFGLPRPGSESDKFGTGSDYSSDSFSQPSGHGEDFMFSQDQLDMFGLTTLERDPSILGLGGEDIYIKPELLSNP